MAEHASCSDPECREHGIAASLARQSEFYAANERVDARPDEEPVLRMEGLCDARHQHEVSLLTDADAVVGYAFSEDTDAGLGCRDGNVITVACQQPVPEGQGDADDLCLGLVRFNLGTAESVTDAESLEWVAEYADKMDVA